MSCNRHLQRWAHAICIPISVLKIKTAVDEVYILWQYFRSTSRSFQIFEIDSGIGHI